jgi:hypothetical protein
MLHLCGTPVLSKGGTALTIRRKNRVREISKCYAYFFARTPGTCPHAQKKQKRDKNRAPRAFFSLLLDFVAPYWLSALPP